jgi:hypothetical protein
LQLKSSAFAAVGLVLISANFDSFSVLEVGYFLTAPTGIDIFTIYFLR